MSIIKSIFPQIDNKAVIVTDCEMAIRNSITNHLPNVPLLRCWMHQMESIDRWLGSHNGKEFDKKSIQK
jgi:hypothetical protein